MVRKQGGVITKFKANEDVLARCIEEIRYADPESKADKLYHVTIKTEAYKKFVMNGFNFITDGYGNFSTIVIPGTTTPEIRELYFVEDVAQCIICFVY